MDKPLTTWYCDRCEEPIENVDEGQVYWRKGPASYGFMIVHTECEPVSESEVTWRDAALRNFVGEEAQPYLLSFLSAGPVGYGLEERKMDLDEYVDFFRRVQTPYYEEARQRFGQPDVAARWRQDPDSNRAAYTPENLRRMIDES